MLVSNRTHRAVLSISIPNSKVTLAWPIDRVQSLPRAEIRDFAERPAAGSASSGNNSKVVYTEDDQKRLFAPQDESQQAEEAASKDDIRNSSVFSADAVTIDDQGSVPQHGLLGMICSDYPTTPGVLPDNRLFQNTNFPFSTFVCGLQGSGKSHTLSCMLGKSILAGLVETRRADASAENCLIQSPMLGNLQKRLSALVVHYSEYTSNLSFRPCEAAFLAYPGQDFPGHPSAGPVRVLVAASNYRSLRAAYAQIPGIVVTPFKLRPHDLNVEAIMALMAVDQTEKQPLYIGQVTMILREMSAASSGGFDYLQFKRRLLSANLNKAQLGPLHQRLQLLESFLTLDPSANEKIFENGGLTVIDLSCPFIDANMACVLFNIGIGLYLGSSVDGGKVIAVDEAHKVCPHLYSSFAAT